MLDCLLLLELGSCGSVSLAAVLAIHTDYHFLDIEARNKIHNNLDPRSFKFLQINLSINYVNKLITVSSWEACSLVMSNPQSPTLSTTNFGIIQFSTGAKPIHVRKLNESQNKYSGPQRNSVIQFKEQVLVVSTPELASIMPVSFLDCLRIDKMVWMIMVVIAQLYYF